MPATFRTTRFVYVEVTSDFIENAYELVAGGDSVVLLGPSGSGKQLVLAQVQERLEEPGCFHVRLRGESLVGTDPERLHDHICAELQKHVAGFTPGDRQDSDSWRLPLRQLLETEPVRIVFLVSNVDALPAFLARNLLKSFRELTDIGGLSAGRFSVLLTGAFDLAPLVYGADSEFSVRDQYVIQGFGIDKFVEFFMSYAMAAGLKADRQCAEFLFSNVGGHLALLRLVMEDLLDSRRANKLPIDEPVTVAEFGEVLAAVGERRALFSDVMCRPLSRLEGWTDSLRMVEELIRFDVCTLPDSGDAVSTNRPRLQAAHRAFEAGLFRVAGQDEDPVERLREFFIGGARALLGFDEATFWKFNDERRDWIRVTQRKRYGSRMIPPRASSQWNLVGKARRKTRTRYCRITS